MQTTQILPKESSALSFVENQVAFIGGSLHFSSFAP